MANTAYDQLNASTFIFPFAIHCRTFAEEVPWTFVELYREGKQNRTMMRLTSETLTDFQMGPS